MAAVSRALLDLRRERGHRHVLAAIEQQIAVDLVGDDPEIALQAGRRHALELRATVDAAHRVVRVAEHEGPRAGRDGGGEGVEIDHVAPAAVTRQHVLFPHAPQVAPGAQDRRIGRRLQQDALARRGQRPAREVVGDVHAGHQHDGLGAHAPAVALGHALGDRLRQLGMLGEVAEEAVGDARLESREHRGRRGEIHVGHPQGQHVGAELVPLVAVAGAAVGDAVEVEAGGHGSGSSWRLSS